MEGMALGGFVAPKSSIATLAGATHFVYLDRPEHGRTQLVELLERFLAQD